MGCETVEKNSPAEIYAVRRNAYFPVRIVTNLSHLILAPSHFQLYGEQGHRNFNKASPAEFILYSQGIHYAELSIFQFEL